MHRTAFLSLAILLFGWSYGRTDDAKPLGPVEARKEVGKTITVEMTIKSAKDRLEKHNEIYLDAEENFKDPKNFAIVITKKGATKFKEAGIDSPANNFRGKTVRAKGVVKEVQKVPRIEIDDPAKLQIVGMK